MGERRTRAAVPNKGLGVGEKLNRQRLLAESDIRWNWIGTDVKHVSDIKEQHCLRAAGIAFVKPKRLCKNKYKSPCGLVTSIKTPDNEDAIIISDGEDDPYCERKRCKDNPYCMNHLGQDKWEDEVKAEAMYLQANLKIPDPSISSREKGIPVGLKNLGATCYANAFLQVWFQDLAFRSGVYKCQPSYNGRQHFKDSPIFQLQVTFTALQEGNKRVYNPIKLVESLRLRTSEQQDAQEFSKLFMSHLDQEFKKQPNPELQTLLEDQFEGKIVNATVCDGCKTRSERMASFLELEVNLEKNAVLEDRLEAILKPERLDEDNKYFCSRCNSLQLATRVTEIRSLPPVLHVSVLRFVYDFTILERKKSKLPLRFPSYLDMNPFITLDEQANDSERGSKEKSSNCYELRGVLLHKGLSAYHGHYEAQVYDRTMKEWFQFNDETVIPLPSFHQDPQPEQAIIVDENDGSERPTKRQKRSVKVRRVEDSDDGPLAQVPNTKNGPKQLVSRDAYMLIYARCDEPGSSCVPLPIPPSDALSIIEAENKEHEQALQEYDKRREKMKAEFVRRRNMVMDVCSSWTLTFAKDPSFIVSRRSLEKWIAQSFSVTESGNTWRDNPYATVLSSQDSQSPVPDILLPDSSLKSSSAEPRSDSWDVIDSSDLLCNHGNVNPLLDKDMKLVSEAGRDKLLEYGFTLEPKLTKETICRTCVERKFTEKLYQIEHPKLVAEFNSVCNTDGDGEGYWISKQWVKDWQSHKSKMHTSQGDPPPDAPEYNAHVLCEHKHLAINAKNRRLISESAVFLLQQIYPEWKPPEWDARSCPNCEASLHLSKEIRTKQRRDAEFEKEILPRLYEDNVSGWNNIADSQCCMVVPSEFIDTWRAWIDRPGDNPHPGRLMTERLICDHGGIRVDFSDRNNFTDEFSSITSSEWDILQERYGTSPTITISQTELMNGNGKVVTQGLRTEPSLCNECCLNDKLNFGSTFLTVIYLDTKEAVPSLIWEPQDPEFGLNHTSVPNGKKNGISSGIRDGFSMYSSASRRVGSRSSQRIKESKFSRRKVLNNITKLTTLKSIKYELAELFGMGFNEISVYYSGVELIGEDKTVEEFSISAKSTLYLKKINDIIRLDSDDEDGLTLLSRRESEAFQGSLLRGSHPSTSHAPTIEQSEMSASPPPTETTFA